MMLYLNLSTNYNLVLTIFNNNENNTLKELKIVESQIIKVLGFSLLSYKYKGAWYNNTIVTKIKGICIGNTPDTPITYSFYFNAQILLLILSNTLP